jgi:hypothetical protein
MTTRFRRFTPKRKRIYPKWRLRLSSNREIYGIVMSDPRNVEIRNNTCSRY